MSEIKIIISEATKRNWDNCSTGSCCGCVTLESSSLPHAHKAKKAEANGNIYLFLITNPFLGFEVLTILLIIY